MKEGWKLEGDDQHISLYKGDKRLKFDKKICTTKGTLFAMKIEQNEEISAITQVRSENKKELSVVEAHNRLGHLSVKLTEEVARNLGWRLSGDLDRCEDCAIGKGKQKNVIKRSNHIIAEKVGERLFLDLAAVFEERNSDAPADPTKKGYWRILVDEASQFKISDFFSSKRDMIEPTCEKIFKWQSEGKSIKYIRCDDGGENRGLKNRLQSSDWKIPIKFEFTGRDTPQRNHLAEVALATIAGRGRAIMSAANIPKEHRRLFWREAFQTATYMDGFVLVTIGNIRKTRFEHWEGKLPRFSEYLRRWGEAGVVKLRTSTTPKIYDRGKVCMFVGYSPDHHGDTLRMWDPDTKRVHLSRDVVWLKKIFFGRKNYWIERPYMPYYDSVAESNLEAEETLSCSRKNINS